MRGSYEFEEKGYLINGYISGPITDTLGIRVAAQFNDIDEFQLLQENTPAVNQERGLTDFIGRVTLDFNPSDRFRANLKVSNINTKEEQNEPGLDLATRKKDGCRRQWRGRIRSSC